MDRSIAQLDLRTTRIEGKLDTISVQIQANADQRERMEETLEKIESHLRVLNGRTRKSEDAVAELRFGQMLSTELSRALALQPDGTVVVSQQRPALSKGQKAGMAAIAAPMLLGCIELLRQAVELATAVMGKK